MTFDILKDMWCILKIMITLSNYDKIPNFVIAFILLHNVILGSRDEIDETLRFGRAQ